MNKSKIKTILIALLLASTSNSAWAIEPVDGWYQIWTAQDWNDFCTLHNEGDRGQNLNAILMADITVEGNNMIGINGPGKPYRGIFNGQGHKLTINYNLNEERVAPFRRINGANIKNLIVEGSITTTSKLAAGIVGGLWQSGSTIQNCVSKVTINDTNSGDATHGGICGSFEDVNGPNTIENCAFVGAIFAPNRNGCGGIVGWTNNNDNNNIIRNCYVNATLNVKQNDNNDIVCRNDANVLNCYFVGNIDGLKNDHGATSKPAEELLATLGSGWYQHFTYTEFPVPFVDASFVPADQDGFFQISNGQDLSNFALYVNTCANFSFGRLTADIDMNGIPWTPIGQDAHDFHGHFDGLGHRILNLTTSAGYNNQALFGQAVGTTIIENIIIDASCNIQGAAYTAGILGHVWGDYVTVRNCGNEADINGTGNNAAGIVGCSERIVYIENCFNTGNIVGANENAGICAWMGSNSSTLVNCYSSGNVTNGEGLKRKNEVTPVNCYQIDGLQGTAFTAEQMASGELAYDMNKAIGHNVWFQKLGDNADAHPVPFGSNVVYANGSLYCDGMAKPDVIFENEEKESVRDDHAYTDGICSNSHDNIICGEPQEEYATLENGVYQLTNGKELKWFAAWVDRKDATASSKMMNNLNMSGVSGFAGIGDSSHPYTGTFDGQNHIISNLIINMPNESNVGLFRDITAGAHIKNLTIDNTCEFRGDHYAAAFVGHVSGNGEALLEQLGNEANVTISNQNAGGIVGCNTSVNLKLTLRNCYNVGTISSAREGGGLSGWLGNDAVTVNCYNNGTVNGGESFARGNNIQLTNCFDPVTNWDGINTVDATAFTDGSVFAKLFDTNNVWRFVDGDNAHPVLYGNMIALSENSENNLIGDRQFDVAFFRTIKKGGWNTFCVPFAMTPAQIAEYFGSGTEVAQLKEGSFTDDMLHFELATEIVAGKAYLVWPDISADFTEAAINGVTIAATDPATGITQAGYTFQGVFEPTKLTANTDFIVVADNKIVKTSGGNIKGFRAYFKGSNNARATSFVIDDTEATGIITAEGEVVMDAPVYNMQGQRVKGSTRGLYITNGKKYVVK